jgi:hypothetical protein
MTPAEARKCWICSQPHNPDKAEIKARLHGREPQCRHREEMVELAIERARAIASDKLGG